MPKPKGQAKTEVSKSKPGMAPRLVATTLLTRVIDDNRNLDALCDGQHGLKEFLSLAEADRALARAIGITALRNRTRIETAIGKVVNRPPPKNARFLIHSLHVAAAQILFMNVPESAAVDLAVSAIGSDRRTSRFRGFANAVLRKLASGKTIFENDTQKVSPFPRWLEKALRKDFGADKLAKVGESVANPPLLDITVKSNPHDWAEKLGGLVLPNESVRLLSNQSVTGLNGYAAGEWWVQDAAAAIPATLVKPKTGKNVLEICAAPGGKTAQLVHAGYTVTALDISTPRLKRLEENLNRLQLEASLVEADILHWENDKKYDAVLLDAPCSSTGTMRRHPDVIWTRSSEDVSELAALQLAMVKKAAGFVKPGGQLIFSNCSILKEEGEDLVAGLVKSGFELSLVPLKKEEVFGMSDLINGQGVLRSLPYQMEISEKPEASGMDGFFACKFIRD
ncbi:MAG: transcription antitermination factor NusB [Pseudomonadota bacterium]